MASCGSFKDQLEGFFTALKLNLIEVSQHLPPGTVQEFQENYTKKSKFSHSPVNTQINPPAEDLVNHLIRLSQLYLTPMFLELVLVHNDSNDCFTTLEAGLEDGWKYLQRYFSTWIHSLEFPPRFSYPYKERRPNWSDTRVVIQHLLSLAPWKQPPANGLPKYLFLQWYNKNR